MKPVQSSTKQNVQEFQRSITIKRIKQKKLTEATRNPVKGTIYKETGDGGHSPDPIVMVLTSMHRSMPEQVMHHLRDPILGEVDN